LRDQLRDGGRAHDDERIGEVLRSLYLGPLVERVGGLDAVHDWPATLSAGEQQLLAVARLLLAEPAFAFLDHTTSALDERRRQNVYQRLSETSITYISIGDHDHPSMRKFHDTLLEIEESGAWRAEELGEPGGAQGHEPKEAGEGGKTLAGASG
jgi:putative ATP-binding cassette transporter